MEKVKQEVDILYKRYFGKMVTSLLAFSSDIDLPMAEDLVQDSFSSALTSWNKDQIPANPAGWIFRVCRNKAINKIRKNSKVSRLSGKEAPTFAVPAFRESFFDDEQLKLLFISAHPALSPKVQVVITLKYVINFKVETIAKVFGMTVDGVDKLLQRARQKIKMEKLFLEEPDKPTLMTRVHVVHKVIYLIFNEGYKASWGKEILREELCEEALLLNDALLKSSLYNHETKALHALMLFNTARIKARFTSSGELLELEAHDRKLWNRDLIRLGSRFLKASGSEPASSYHYEASIAYLHCTAEDFKATRWSIISDLYKKLLLLNSNPFVELSYAISLYYAGQKEQALTLLYQLERSAYLNQYFLLNATLGKINFLEGNYPTSKKYFEKALRQTHFEVEKKHILKMIEKTDKLL